MPWLLLEQSRNQITPEASFAVGDVLQAGDHQHEIWLSVGERVDRASPAPYLPVEALDRVVRAVRRQCSRGISQYVSVSACPSRTTLAASFIFIDLSSSAAAMVR